MVSETPKSINVFASTPSNLSTLVISTSLTSMVDPLSVIFADDSILPFASDIISPTIRDDSPGPL